MEKILIIPGQIEGIRTLKDRSMKITVETQELAPELGADLLRAAQKYGYIAFKEDKFGADEFEYMASLKSDYTSAKTPSQRLRNVLYRLWEFDAKGFDEFRSYYDSMMEKLIQHYKNKLDE